MANARSPKSESGFAIIEVVVSAAVLAIVALAVLSGIDGATGSSAREKARAVASSLAEKDQERLRAMSVETLTAVPQSPAITVDGVTYTIKSQAGWVNDDTGGTPACGNSSNKSEYFHITSTVTSELVGARIPPVRIDSLVSPTVSYAQDHGTVGAKIVDRNGAGLPGITVWGTGAQSLPAQITDQNGCVLWRSVAVGAYTININTSGYCDEAGKTPVSRGQNVSPNTVSFVNFTYDRCASANVNVFTHIPGKAFSTTSTQASKAREITDLSSNGSLKTWVPQSGASASTYTVTNLFPYPSKAYGFFTGECGYQSPEKLGLSNYFTNTNPGASLLADATKPPADVKVFQPPVNIRINRAYSAGPLAAGAVDVFLTLIKPASFSADTCADEVFKFSIMNWPTTGGWGAVPADSSTAPANPAGWVSQTSTAFDPGLPFGTYSICLKNGSYSYQYTTSTATQYKNTNVDDVKPPLVIDVPRSSWSTGVTCAQ